MGAYNIRGSQIESITTGVANELHAKSVATAYLNGFGRGGGGDAEALSAWLCSSDRTRLIGLVGEEAVRAFEASVGSVMP